MIKTEKIYRLTKEFINQECVYAKITYGSMFILDFGKKQSPIPPSKHPTFDWSLQIGNSTWKLNQADKELATDDSDETQIKTALKKIENKKIVDFKISEENNHTVFSFEDDIILTLDPLRESNTWSLKEPKGMYLNIGPHNYWEYISGDTKPKYY